MRSYEYPNMLDCPNCGAKFQFYSGRVCPVCGAFLR